MDPTVLPATIGVYGDWGGGKSSIMQMLKDALLAFMRKKLSDREIAAGLLGNGTLPLNRLSLYVDLVRRMRAEVLVWLRGSGSAYLKNEVCAC